MHRLQSHRYTHTRCHCWLTTKTMDCLSRSCDSWVMTVIGANHAWRNAATFLEKWKCVVIWYEWVNPRIPSWVNVNHQQIDSSNYETIGCALFYFPFTLNILSLSRMYRVCISWHGLQLCCNQTMSSVSSFATRKDMRKSFKRWKGKEEVKQ